MAGSPRKKGRAIADMTQRTGDEIEPMPERLIDDPSKLRPGASQIEILDAVGVDAICNVIAQGHFATELCAKLGVTKFQFTDWVTRDLDRRRRVNEARKAGAEVFAGLAERVLREAKSGAELSRAKELAHHYRWVAGRLAPAEFGDKLEVTNPTDHKELPDDELDRRIARLAGIAIGAYQSASKPASSAPAKPDDAAA